MGYPLRRMANMLPDEKQTLLNGIVEELRRVPGVAAVALGGSHARGTQKPDSDLDVGVYYLDASPFAIDPVRKLAESLSHSGAPTVTGFYDWGPFVNGGAWIDNKVCKIDLLYRNLDQIDRTITEADLGRWEHSFDQQPPFGFRTVTTLGEIACCLPLFDPDGQLDRLKRRVATFPPALKEHILQFALRVSDFTFLIAEDFAASGDVPNAVGCMTRVFHYLVQALFALNETYFINDKRVAAVIEGFARKPDRFYERVSAVLQSPGGRPAELSSALKRLHAIFDEIVVLAGNAHVPLVIPGKSP